MAAPCEFYRPPPPPPLFLEREREIFPYLCCFLTDVFSWLKMGISERIFFRFERENIGTMQDLLGALGLASFSHTIFMVSYVDKICRVVSFFHIQPLCLSPVLPKRRHLLTTALTFSIFSRFSSLPIKRSFVVFRILSFFWNSVCHSHT